MHAMQRIGLEGGMGLEIQNTMMSLATESCLTPPSARILPSHCFWQLLLKLKRSLSPCRHFPHHYHNLGATSGEREPSQNQLLSLLRFPLVNSCLYFPLLLVPIAGVYFPVQRFPA